MIIFFVVTYAACLVISRGRSVMTLCVGIVPQFASGGVVFCEVYNYGPRHPRKLKGAAGGHYFGSGSF